MKNEDQAKNNNSKLPSLLPSIIASILSAIIVTYSVQISMLHFGPYVREVQCFFNAIVLEHTSVDIYESSEVIYWKNAEYYFLQDIRNFFVRYADTVQNIKEQSFIQVNTQKFPQQSYMSMEYFFSIEKNGSSGGFKKCSILLIGDIFAETVYRKQFYQHMKQIKLTTFIPIQNQDDFKTLEVVAEIQFDSNLLMSVILKTNVVLEPVVQEEGQQDKGLGIRKLSDHHRITNQVKFLKWVGIILNISILLYDSKRLILNYQKLKIQPEFANYQTKELLNKLGYQSLLQCIVDFLAIFGQLFNNGLVCLFCWTRLTIFLSYTSNPFMLGFLFKKALPSYAIVIVNIFIILTSFVLFSMVNYGVTMKFENIKLAYYEYLFNYFQYGIYENFMAIIPYGAIGIILYFTQIIILVSIGNNILMSVLAGQLLKTSNQNGLVELLEGIQAKCPNCEQSQKIMKKVKLKLEKNSGLVSRFFDHHFGKQDIQIDYEIDIKSPQISPYFHKDNIKKKSPKTRGLSPKSPLLKIPQKQEYQKRKLLFEIGQQLSELQQNTDFYIKKMKIYKRSLQQLFFQMKTQSKNAGLLPKRINADIIQNDYKQKLSRITKIINKATQSLQ